MLKSQTKRINLKQQPQLAIINLNYLIGKKTKGKKGK